MTVAEFAVAVHTLATRHSASVTSWGRTDLHSKSVGGFAGDPHTWFLGADLVYDGVRPVFVQLKDEAAALGLRLIRETGKPHDHVQPLDFPAGPVTAYGGVTRTLA